MSLQQDLLSLISPAAEKLKTPKKINGVDFDGSKDITIGSGGAQVGDATTIAGIPVVLGQLQNGDVIEYQGFAWTNSNKDNITDGGNF